MLIGWGEVVPGSSCAGTASPFRTWMSWPTGSSRTPASANTSRLALVTAPFPSLFSSLPEERTHRVWLCDLGDLCGEKSGFRPWAGWASGRSTTCSRASWAGRRRDFPCPRRRDLRATGKPLAQRHEPGSPLRPRRPPTQASALSILHPLILHRPIHLVPPGGVCYCAVRKIGDSPSRTAQSGGESDEGRPDRTGVSPVDASTCGWSRRVGSSTCRSVRIVWATI